jgi:hypothetical protein
MIWNLFLAFEGISLLHTLATFDVEGSAEFSLEVASSVFALVLFGITIYAWNKRGRQPTLLIVSFGFIAFFLKQLVEILPLSLLHSELFTSAMDFLTLGLFFIALVVRPQRKEKLQSEKARA